MPLCDTLCFRIILTLWHGKNQTIRSVERTIDLLQVLHRRSPISLSQLSKATSTPKSSVLRILLTLQNSGVFRCGFYDKLYRFLPRLSFSGTFDVEMGRFAELGELILKTLNQKIRWPLDLVVRPGLYMESFETNRRQSPFAPSMDVSRLRERINVITSSVGRA